MPQQIKRIILHWTGGTHSVSAADRAHYHRIIDGDGPVHDGHLPPEENISTADGLYAAHARACNTGAVGVALAGMQGAVERPFQWGRHPLRPAQLEALAGECARLCVQYGLPVRRETVLTHAEIQPTLGIAQRGKWDITVLPGMHQPGAPVEVGDELRARIDAALKDPAPLNPAARIGDNGALQRWLIAQGYDPGPVDGLWGPQTQAAFRAWAGDISDTPPAPGGPLFAAATAAMRVAIATPT